LPLPLSNLPTMNDDVAANASPAAKDPLLTVLGERVRALRARAQLTRRALAREAGISERHLANLESGQGNASVLLLRQLTRVLHCTIGELIGEDALATPAWRQIRAMIEDRSDADLEQVRLALAQVLGAAAPAAQRCGRIALIGLRGAGKSTLGAMLADDLGVPFIELTRVIERLAGCDVREIHALYGAAAYRRYEMRALEEAVRGPPRAVIATGGGVVGEAATFDLLRARCFTVWLRAAPDEHMARVLAQGDLRPMAGNAEAMADLQRILASREALYAQADVVVDTGSKPLADAFAALRAAIPPNSSSEG
jgi:XRE family transcriptional regulator, aerobic/anaerobic benzoate catabolism transcriptional regulator